MLGVVADGARAARAREPLLASAGKWPGKTPSVARRPRAGGGDERDELVAQLGEQRRAARRSSGPARSRRAARRRGARTRRCRRSTRRSGACSSSTRSSAARKSEKSLRRARLHPGLLARARRRCEISAARSVGTLTAFSMVAAQPADQPRVVGVGVLPTPPTARARRAGAPSSGSVIARRAGSRSSASNWSARASAPPGGIIVFWSQNSRPPIAVQVGDLRRRAAQLGELGGLGAHRPARA